MVLQLADLPMGFERVERRYVSNALMTKRQGRVAMLYPKDYAKLGRISGYEASYRRSVTHGGGGASSKTETYRTVRGAHRSFLMSAAAWEGASGRKPKRLTLGAPLGAEARLFWQTVPPRGASVHRKVWETDLYVVFWRHGPVLAEIYLGGELGHNPRTVIALARKQQLRIIRATG